MHEYEPLCVTALLEILLARLREAGHFGLISIKLSFPRTQRCIAKLGIEPVAGSHLHFMIYCCSQRSNCHGDILAYKSEFLCHETKALVWSSRWPMELISRVRFPAG